MAGRSAAAAGLISGGDMATGGYQQTKLDQLSFVMAGLRPGHPRLCFLPGTKDVDARHRRQVYAVCAGRLLWPGMTSHLCRPAKTKAPAARPGLQFAI